MSHITPTKLTLIEIEDFLRDFKKEGAVSIDDLKLYQELIYKDILLPYISANYLSHWKSSIENLINERLRKKYSESLTSDSEYDYKQHHSFRFYSIEISEGITNNIPARMTEYEYVDRIVYDQTKNKYNFKEIRYLIAHEFGHIIINRLFPAYGITVNLNNIEDLAHFWACFIIYDKSCFYHNNVSLYAEKDFKDIHRHICDTYRKYKI